MILDVATSRFHRVCNRLQSKTRSQFIKFGRDVNREVAAYREVVDHRMCSLFSIEAP
jgi:hypothetical protein